MKNFIKNQKEISIWTMLFLFVAWFSFFIATVIITIQRIENFNTYANWASAFIVFFFFALSWYLTVRKKDFNLYKFLFNIFFIFSMISLFFGILWLSMYLTSSIMFDGTNRSITSYELMFKNIFIATIVISISSVIIRSLIKLWYGEPVIDFKQIKIELDNNKKRKLYLKEKNLKKKMKEDEVNENKKNK